MEEGLITKEGGFVIANKECGDHGVRWRLAYTPEIPHKLIETGNRVVNGLTSFRKNMASNLATPITHDISKGILKTKTSPGS